MISINGELKDAQEGGGLLKNHLSLLNKYVRKQWKRVSICILVLSFTRFELYNVLCSRLGLIILLLLH